MHLPCDTAECLLNYYRIGPLLYASELELPELAPAAPTDSAALVTISVGRAPERLAAAVLVAPDCEANAREFLVRIAGVATCYVREGTEVLVEPVPGAPPNDLRGYLAGTIFAVLCHQRGLLPLHASAIGTARGAVAFLADSGQGKSSLVAFLARRGHPVLADDICLIDPAAPLASRVLPVAPWLKLWRTALDALGSPANQLEQIYSDEEKYRYRLPAEQPPTALREIILLTRADEQDEPQLAPRFEFLSSARALHAVLELTYQSWLVNAIGQTKTYFLRCAEVLEGVRVCRMYRPWGFEAMDTTLDALEAHLTEHTAAL